LRIALNQIKLWSIFVAHENRIYLRELGGNYNFSYTTGYTRAYQGLHGSSRVKWGVQGFTGVYKGKQGHTYKGVQGYIRVYNGIQGYTRVYRGT